ncbi:MAG: LysR family transcriptional regulator [Lautropia sp.]
MNLRAVETFICVAECSSFRRAAELLHRSQSAVSVHVRQLEEDLGVPLFDRTTRRVALTAEGRTLLARTKVVVSELRAVADELRETSGVRGGMINVGVTPSLAARVLPMALAEFGRSYPDVTVRVQEAVSRGLYEAVRQRKTDFALGPAVPGLKDFDYRIFARAPLVAVVPRDYPVCGRAGLPFKELVRGPFLAVAAGAYLRRLLEDTARARGVAFTPKFEFGSFAAVLGQVAAGVGVSILPALAVDAHERERLHVLSLRSPALGWDNCVLKLKGKRLSPPATRLADVVSRLAGASAA